MLPSILPWGTIALGDWNSNHLQVMLIAQMSNLLTLVLYMIFMYKTKCRSAEILIFFNTACSLVIKGDMTFRTSKLVQKINNPKHRIFKSGGVVFNHIFGYS